MEKVTRSDFQRSLGLRIKALRERREWSQEELADELGVHRVALTQIENAQREVSAEEIAALSKVFEISADVLLDLKKDIEVILQEGKGDKKKQISKMRISVPEVKVDKFKEVLLYILSRIGSRPNVGETVIWKLLYFIDFDFYEKYEEHLIGATYIKNTYGPTPVESAKIIGRMIESGEVISVKTQRSGFDQKKYIPNREPDLSKLKAHEIKLIDEVLERLSHMGARQISEYSHGDIPWVTTEEQARIDYESVFYRTPQYSVRAYDDPEGAL
jgi:transcriptional regulator with XRE-family HTH domain